MAANDLGVGSVAFDYPAVSVGGWPVDHLVRATPDLGAVPVGGCGDHGLRLPHVLAQVASGAAAIETRTVGFVNGIITKMRDAQNGTVSV